MARSINKHIGQNNNNFSTSGAGSTAGGEKSYKNSHKAPTQRTQKKEHFTQEIGKHAAPASFVERLLVEAELLKKSSAGGESAQHPQNQQEALSSRKGASSFSEETKEEQHRRRISAAGESLAEDEAAAGEDEWRLRKSGKSGGEAKKTQKKNTEELISLPGSNLSEKPVIKLVVDSAEGSKAFALRRGEMPSDLAGLIVRECAFPSELKEALELCVLQRRDDALRASGAKRTELGKNSMHTAAPQHKVGHANAHGLQLHSFNDAHMHSGMDSKQRFQGKKARLGKDSPEHAYKRQSTYQGDSLSNSISPPVMAPMVGAHPPPMYIHQMPMGGGGVYAGAVGPPAMPMGPYDGYRIGMHGHARDYNMHYYPHAQNPHHGYTLINRN